MIPSPRVFLRGGPSQKSQPRIAAPLGGVRKADRTLLVTSTGNVPGNRRQSLAVQETAVTQPAVRGVLNGAIARSRELRRQVRLYLCFNKCFS